MRHYQSFDPEAEIIGGTAQSLVTSIMHDELAPVLERHGLNDIDPAGWYNVQSLLDIFNDISGEGGNVSEAFVSVGMAAAELSWEAMPPQLKSISLQEFFSKYDAIWQSRHRKGDVGHVQCQLVSDNQLTLTVQSPYPDDIFYGAFYAYARHFKPKGKSFTVAYDENSPTQEQGGQETVILIEIKD